MQKFILSSEPSKKNALATLALIPIDAKKPMLVEIKPFVKKRTPPQNALMWSAMMDGYVNHGWVDGRQFSAKTWHEQLKEWFMPEVFIEGITLDGYKKGGGR